MPFRPAYKVTGQLVARCIADASELESLPLAVYREYSDAFEADLYDEIRLETCVARRTSEGGTSPDSVLAQVAYVREFLKDV